jgi:hypothetical protein
MALLTGSIGSRGSPFTAQPGNPMLAAMAIINFEGKFMLRVECQPTIDCSIYYLRRGSDARVKLAFGANPLSIHG